MFFLDEGLKTVMIHLPWCHQCFHRVFATDNNISPFSSTKCELTIYDMFEQGWSDCTMQNKVIRTSKPSKPWTMTTIVFSPCQPCYSGCLCNVVFLSTAWLDQVFICRKHNNPSQLRGNVFQVLNNCVSFKCFHRQLKKSL